MRVTFNTTILQKNIFTKKEYFIEKGTEFVVVDETDNDYFVNYDNDIISLRKELFNPFLTIKGFTVFLKIKSCKMLNERKFKLKIFKVIKWLNKRYSININMISFNYINDDVLKDRLTIKLEEGVKRNQKSGLILTIK